MLRLGDYCLPDSPLGYNKIPRNLEQFLSGCCVFVSAAVLGSFPKVDCAASPCGGAKLRNNCSSSGCHRNILVSTSKNILSFDRTTESLRYRSLNWIFPQWCLIYGPFWCVGLEGLCFRSSLPNFSSFKHVQAFCVCPGVRKWTLRLLNCWGCWTMQFHFSKRKKDK